MAEHSPAMETYFSRLDTELQRAYAVAQEARKQGFDPEPKVDIPIAKNMAERVEGLISAVTDKLTGTGMTARIHELEQQHGILSWKVALLIAEEVAREKFCTFTDVREAMEIGIRVGFAYHTLGIVAAPLEGFIDLKIKKRKDGKEYVAACYAGPIRGAGGTAAAFSVILTDYVRTRMGYAAFDPTEEEINHITTEVIDYHERVTNLQYFPSEEELRFLLKHIPIEISGDPTEQLEISNYKDAGRIETNMIRGGVCLVTAEGLSQKAAKLWVRLKEWGKEYHLNWEWLEEFLTIQKAIKAKHGATDTPGEKPKISPNYTYISDIVAGRPVLTSPMAAGGLRLRYGRARCSGFSSAAVHPATFVVLNRYFATGTQLKVERPGKATALTICDTIDGPIVKLTNGSVLQLQNEAIAKKILPEVAEILFLGDILYSYGDFSVNGHPLVPAGYCPEWWHLELQKALRAAGVEPTPAAVAVRVGIPEEEASMVLADPFAIPTFITSRALAKSLSIPLHAAYLPYWSCCSQDQFLPLVDWLLSGEVEREGEQVRKIILPIRDIPKRTLELIGVPHTVSAHEYAVIEGEWAAAIHCMLGLHLHTPEEVRAIVTAHASKPALEIIALLTDMQIRDKAGTFIGSRMGRPEKAKMRELTGRPQVLFPVGEQGGVMRSFQEALSAGEVEADFPLLYCATCKEQTVYRRCDRCGDKPEQRYHCRFCGPISQPKCQHGPANKHKRQRIVLKRYFDNALGILKTTIYPDLIKGVTGTSNKDHIPEHLAKGILRAKHGIAVNKDGTTRYDMTELPITHFRPLEIRTSVEKLRELGYTHDCRGQPLERADQVCEIKTQDVILSSSVEALDDTSDKVLLNVAAFTDELLETLYGQPAYYKLSKPMDLVGHLIVGLAPHISAGIVGRIIGFSDTQGFLTHPLFHAAMRRDCDGDEACVILLMDALLNFSRQFLPNNRGGRTMDSPLVLTSRLVPGEVDDMAHGLDTAWQYPLELYEAALEYKDTKEVKVEQIKDRLGTEAQYEGMGYTHELTSINIGNNCSAYKTIPSMQDKLKGQMELAEKIRAVDPRFVAELVIEKHFIKDIKGNLRKFSTQKFRCVKCNEKFRRPPLLGKCLECGGKLIFTVTEGSVIKYLEPSMSLARKYNLSPYLYQTLEITQRRIEGVFGREKEKQVGLGAWFG